MRVVKAILRTFIGLLFGLLCLFTLTPAFAAFADSDGGLSHLVWVVVLLGIALGFFAPTIRRAFGRGFLMIGACALALPLSTLLLSGRVASDMIAVTAAEGQAAAAFGAGMAGTLMTGASAIVGFILGTILILIGLVLTLGGRREVIIVERRAE